MLLFNTLLRKKKGMMDNGSDDGNEHHHHHHHSDDQMKSMEHEHNAKTKYLSDRITWSSFDGNCSFEVMENEEYDFINSNITSNDVMHVESSAVLFKEFSMKEEPSRKMKRRSIDSNISTTSSLASIDENSEYNGNEYINERKVKVSTIIFPHNGTKCARFVAAKLHSAITEHPSFTSPSNFPLVLRDAFWSTDNEFLNLLKETNSNDDSGCSVITALITSKNEMCIGHVGNTRAIIQGLDGNIKQLSQPHLIAECNEERDRLIHSGIRIDDNNTILGKCHVSRAFGFSSVKKLTSDGLICFPYVAQLQLKLKGKVVQKRRRVDYTAKHSPSSLSTSSSSESKSYSMIIGYSPTWGMSDDKKMVGAVKSSAMNPSLEPTDFNNEQLLNFVKSSRKATPSKESADNQAGLWVAQWHV